MRNPEPQASPHSVIERRGSSVAHAGALLIGIPLTVFFLDPPFSFAPCPVIAYMIARSFRRRKLAWGAFQGMQASLIQLFIFILAAATVYTGELPRLAGTFGVAAFLLFLYSLKGGLDTLLGYDFRYLGVGSWLERVARVNMERPEPRRRRFGGRDRDDADKTSSEDQ